jgi:hypothetical protein
MADFGDSWTYVAIGVLIAFAIGMAMLGLSAFKGYKEMKKRTAIEAELDDILRREELQLLRHRDFDGFVKRVNEMRAEKGQSPIEREFLEKIQYNLMYALDESDF